MDWDEIKKHVGEHTEEGQKTAGAWRWRGLWDNRERLIPLLEGKEVLDIGGASGPVGYGDICDIIDTDILGRPVPYKTDIGITKKFDTIFASHILEHYKYPGTHIERWCGYLKKGGHVIIQVPSMYNLSNHPLFNEKHHWVFTLEGDLEQGYYSKMLPLCQIVSVFFDIEFIEYVGNASILCIGVKKCT